VNNVGTAFAIDDASGKRNSPRECSDAATFFGQHLHSTQYLKPLLAHVNTLLWFSRDLCSLLGTSHYQIIMIVN